jgi:outer membrane murein-binding lipoprotein Lpp
MIVIAIVGIIVVVVGGAFLSGCSSDWQKAETAAKEFASKVNGATGEVQCAKKDTDKDGYCGCTVFMKKGNPMAIDCGCQKFCWNCAEGCKIVNPGKGMRVNVRNYGGGSSQ